MKLASKRFPFILLFSLVLAIGIGACTAAGSEPVAEPVAPEEIAQPEGQAAADVAREAAASNMGQEENDEFFGTVEAIDGDVWTIDGQTFVASNLTELKGTFAPGDRVKVHTTIQEDGTIIMREVELADDDDPDDEMDDESDDDSDDEFTGTLEAIDGDIWTIDGMDFVVTDTTELEGDFAVGDIVKVHTLTQADGSIVLREVELADDDDMDDEMDDDSYGDDYDDDSDDDYDDDYDDGSDDDSYDDDYHDDSDDGYDDDSDDDSNGDSDDDHDDSEDDSDDNDDDSSDDKSDDDDHDDNDDDDDDGDD